MSKDKAYMNWSGGKDSALCLSKVIEEGKFEIGTLLTTINKQNRRVSMHGTPEKLLKQQAESIGLPLKIVEIPENCDMQAYNTVMNKVIEELQEEGYEYSIFGDIHLEDLKEYKENKFKDTEIKPIFPLWKNDTNKVITEFIEKGFKAITTSVNARLLNESHIGKVIDKEFIKSLPNEVDLCGENGEFHTFVFDGPIFNHPINFNLGQIVKKTYKSGKEWDNEFLFIELDSK